MIEYMKNELRRLVYTAIMAYWARKIEYYVVGYPKTGNTWFLMMLRRLLVNAYGLPETAYRHALFTRLWKRQAWKALPEGIPVIHATHHMPCYNSETSAEMRLSLSPFKGKKVILLNRDPKDVLVSLWFHNVFRCNPPLYNGTLSEMVRDSRYGLDKYLRYYQTFYEDLRIPSDVLLVRYEDHSADPAAMVRKTADFLGLETVTDEMVGDIVAFSSFDNMKKMEKSNALGSQTLAPAQSDTPQASKVRKGKVGGYREHLDEGSIRYIDDALRQYLPEFYGYPLAPDGA